MKTDTERSIETLFICGHADASTLLAAFHYAGCGQEAGQQTGILFTGEALAAWIGGVFAWPRGLAASPTRLQMADRGKALGVPIAGRGEGRYVDPPAMLEHVREKGVRVLACPLFAELLAAGNALVSQFECPTQDEMLNIISSSRSIIGSL